MAKKFATERGFIGGRIIEPGEVIDWPHERVPRWLRDPEPGDAVVETETVDASKPAGKGRGGRKKAETVDAASAEPFGDAPEPIRVENEANAATGGTQPDWVAPQPVTD